MHGASARTRAWRRGAALLGVLAAAALSGGCGRTMINSRLNTSYEPSDLTSEMGFWHSLPGRPAVSNDEGLHGLIILAAGDDRSKSYGDRVAFAKGKGWLDRGWDEPAGQAMQRGILARAICLVCGIQGGVMMHVLGPTPRYALREAAYEGIMVESSEQQTISGLDYLGVVSKAQDYITAHPAPAEPGGRGGGA